MLHFALRFPTPCSREGKQNKLKLVWKGAEDEEACVLKIQQHHQVGMQLKTIDYKLIDRGDILGKD